MSQFSTIAESHAPCSAHVNATTYIDVIVPPPDRSNVSAMAYFIGAHPPSTCALFACGVWRLCGLTDDEICGSYRIGSAVANVESVAARYGAWRVGTPDRPLQDGDVCIIDDGSGHDAHVMCFTGTPVVSKATGVYMVTTCEGGQNPDSSGIGSFTRAMVPKADGKLYCGSRHVIGWVDGTKMPYAVVADPITADPHL